MSVLRSIVMAFSAFSRIPMPKVKWEEKNMRFMMAAFPLVGAVVGAALLFWFWVCEKLNFGAILFSAGITIIPQVITGGIHMDGFCDTVDAMASHKSAEERRKILKDPHAGAFAIIWACAYMLGYFALCTELAGRFNDVLMLAVAHVMTRTVSAAASLIQASSGEGMLSTFKKGANKTAALVVVTIIFLLCIVTQVVLDTVCGLIITYEVIAAGLLIGRMAKRDFGGMSGDVAGYLLQTAEIGALIAIVLVGKVF